MLDKWTNESFSKIATFVSYSLNAIVAAVAYLTRETHNFITDYYSIYEAKLSIKILTEQFPDPYKQSMNI